MNNYFHAFVTGRVQGVWFRDSTARKAATLSVTGFVRNLGDGRVEVYACCDDLQRLDALKQWLWQGPPLAKVLDIEFVDDGYHNLNDFQILSDA